MICDSDPCSASDAGLAEAVRREKISARVDSLDLDIANTQTVLDALKRERNRLAEEIGREVAE